MHPWNFLGCFLGSNTKTELGSPWPKSTPRWTIQIWKYARKLQWKTKKSMLPLQEQYHKRIRLPGAQIDSQIVNPKEKRMRKINNPKTRYRWQATTSASSAATGNSYKRNTSCMAARKRCTISSWLWAIACDAKRLWFLWYVIFWLVGHVVRSRGSWFSTPEIIIRMIISEFPTPEITINIISLELSTPEIYFKQLFRNIRRRE